MSIENPQTLQNTEEFARSKDQQDPLKEFRSRFHIPVTKSGDESVYLCGNSLGLQPKRVRDYIDQELEDWARLGVEGHLHARNPWLPYHEFLTEKMARVVGGLNHEVVMMNTLTVNLHVMMVSFYRPTPDRHKIIIEKDAFPSDKYAVKSQIELHGYSVEDSLIELSGDPLIDDDHILQVIEKEGDSVALIMLGNVNYYSGQFFNMKDITTAGHQRGCYVGFDCAHGAGNLPLNLHDSGADFAVWCTYKYLNSGPGSVAGCFVHERHANDRSIPKFAGWWGHNKDIRFKMGPDFDMIPGAEGWQLSNPPILSLAAIRASLDIFDEAGIENLRAKSLELTAYLEHLVNEIPGDAVEIITPKDPNRRGCQLSLRVKNADKTLFDRISEKGIIADWREPDVIRIAPVPLYNSFTDVYKFSSALKSVME